MTARDVTGTHVPYCNALCRGEDHDLGTDLVHGHWPDQRVYCELCHQWGCA